MNQSRLSSLIEALCSIVIGLAVSMVANALVFPRFGFYPSLLDNVAITLIYTAISLVRQYTLRRWFNARLHQAAQAIAARAGSRSHG